MYPRLSDVFSDLFGIHFPIPIYSFGAMLAVAVLTAAWLTRMELDRMYAQGRLSGVRVPAEDGKGKSRRGATKLASPSVLIGTLTFMAAVLGIIGSKLFHILENLPAFYLDPFGMIFSTGGLTFYGGLIVAAVSIAWYVRKKGLSVASVADAMAPGLMLAYGIGRIGCYLAGDGDWGICSDLAGKPGWLPAWLWSETFPRNLLGPGQTPIDVMAYEHCAPGMDGVFPTMLYEFAAAALLFGVLWWLRKHPYRGGWLFSLYLVFNGLERFMIELIRVNNQFDIFGVTATQAEIIAVALIVAGVVGLVITSRRRGDDGTAEARAEARAEDKVALSSGVGQTSDQRRQP